MKVIILIAVLAFVAVEYGAAEFRCTLGVPYKENDCNICMCGNDGKLACTYKLCSGARFDKLRDCEVGTQSDQGCNKCECVAELGNICTNNSC